MCYGEFCRYQPSDTGSQTHDLVAKGGGGVNVGGRGSSVIDIQPANSAKSLNANVPSTPKGAVLLVITTRLRH